MGGAPMHGRNEEVLARRHQLARRLSSTGLCLSTPCSRFEGWRGVREFLDALPDRGEIRDRLDAAGRAQIDRARLVPIDAIGTDAVLNEPPLLDPAARVRGSLPIGLPPPPRPPSAR